MNDRAPAVLVTGAAGSIGSLTMKALSARRDELRALVALDVREVASVAALPGVSYVVTSVADPALRDVLAKHRIDVIVHLASILRPPKENGEAIAYEVDVLGTENVLAASVALGVRRLVITTSGAAYGYRPRSHLWLDESEPILGNREIPYAWHKRLIEEKLAEYRERHPELRQLVFRPGTVVGEGVDSPVTELFERPVLLGVRGFDSPFVFISVEDVVACLVRGVFGYETGIYNLAGDGALDPREIARRTGKKYLPLPERVLRLGLSVLHRVGKSPWGPDQVLFLKYRPVLSNRRLKREFGYTPERTSSEAFDHWLEQRRRR